MKNTTNKQYHYKGYTIARGSMINNPNTGYTDDDSRRWYVDNDASNMIDHQGGGFSSVMEAKKFTLDVLSLMDALRRVAEEK